MARLLKLGRDNDLLEDIEDWRVLDEDKDKDLRRIRLGDQLFDCGGIFLPGKPETNDEIIVFYQDTN